MFSSSATLSSRKVSFDCGVAPKFASLGSGRCTFSKAMPWLTEIVGTSMVLTSRTSTCCAGASGSLVVVNTPSPAALLAPEMNEWLLRRLRSSIQLSIRGGRPGCGAILPPRPQTRRWLGLASDHHLQDTFVHEVGPLTLRRGISSSFSSKARALRTAHVTALIEPSLASTRALPEEGEWVGGFHLSGDFPLGVGGWELSRV